MHKILAKCSLFADLSVTDTAYALEYFSAVSRTYSRGDFLNRIGFVLDSFGLVLRGNVQVCMDEIDGHEMIMATISAGECFGESLCYLQLEAPVYIRAVTDCEILWLDPSRVRSRRSTTPIDQRLADRFTAMLARRALMMNDRIQILSQITLRQKLVVFFGQYVRRTGTMEFEVPFDRNDMAVYLGADRAALSRELSRMKKEGIIDFHKNHFRIIQNFHE